MKRALILGPGALYGAYGAGVASVLGRRMYFDKVYGCSVGVYAATFLATEQFDIMLDVWRNYVHGSLLINLKNIFKGRNILDLEYLASLFKKDDFLLDLETISSQKGRLVHVLTRCLTDQPEYFSPIGDNIFESMTASSAVPYAHPAIKINNDYFYDGALSDPYPLRKATDDGSDMVIVVSNFCSGYNPMSVLKFSRLASLAGKKNLEGMDFVEASINQGFKTFLLRPPFQILRSSIDTDRVRINETIDMGIKDAEIFLENFKAL